MDAMISAQDLANLIGLSTRRIRELAEKGVIPRGDSGRYPHPGAIQAYCTGLREQAAGRSGDENGGQELVRERALLAREQREAQAIKNATSRRELISAAEAERRWADEMARLRSRLLAVPTDASQSLPHLTKHDVVVFDRCLRDAMDGAAEGDSEPA